MTWLNYWKNNYAERAATISQLIDRKKNNPEQFSSKSAKHLIVSGSQMWEFATLPCCIL